MIGRLAGVVVHRGEDHVVVDAGGVGYVVFCSDRVLAGLPGVGEPATLWTDLIVREDLLQLFGFPSLVEKEWFRLLMSVQGVGAKAALAVLGTLGPDRVSRAIATGDWASVKSARGIGPKTAQRIVNELRDKVPALMAMGGSVPAEIGPRAAPGPLPSPGAGPAPVSASAQADALSALGNLGYGAGEAASAVAEAAGDLPEADTAALIRAALKRLAPA